MNKKNPEPDVSAFLQPETKRKKRKPRIEVKNPRYQGATPEMIGRLLLKMGLSIRSGPLLIV